MIVSIAGCRTYFDDQGDEGQINGWMDGRSMVHWREVNSAEHGEMDAKTPDRLYICLELS